MAIADTYVQMIIAMFYQNLRELPPNLRDHVEDYSSRIANGGVEVKIPTYAERQVEFRDMTNRTTMPTAETPSYGSHTLSVEESADRKAYVTRFKIDTPDTRDSMVDLVARAALDASRSTMLGTGDFIRGKLDASLESNSNQGQVGTDVNLDKASLGANPGTVSEKNAARVELLEAIFELKAHALSSYWESIPAMPWLNVSTAVYAELLRYYGITVPRYGTGQFQEGMIRSGEFLSQMLGFDVSIDYGIPTKAAADANKRVNRIYAGMKNYGVAFLDKYDRQEQRWVPDELADEFFMAGRMACKVWNPDAIAAVYITGNPTS